MADGKQKKLDTGKALLDTYQKEKHHKMHHGGDFCSSNDDARTSSFCVNEKPKSGQEADRFSMNVATLHKKTGQFESLSHKIRELKDTLSEKNERIETLQIQNQLLLKGNGDQPNIVEESDKVIQRLQSMVEVKDNHIKQLCNSLQSRSEELEQAIQAEKEAIEQLKGVEQKKWASSKQFEVKLAESYHETVEYKAKVELLLDQIKKYSDSEKLLKDSLEEKNKKVVSLQVELEAKDKKLAEYKNCASEQIKQLMSQLEKLNLEISKKEKEVMQTKKEMESLHRSLEEKFGLELVKLKTELEKKYAEDVKKVEQLYDGLLLNHIRKSEEDIKAMDKCSELEDQMSACKISYEDELNTYKDELKKILLKNKENEEQLLCDLKKCKEEADHYRQQVENVENKLAEEVQKIKGECYAELNKFSVEMNAKMTCDQEKIQQYQTEIEKLSVYLREYALSEAKTEIEVESYREELKNSAINISNILTSLEVSKMAHEDLRGKFSLLERELQVYKESNATLQSDLHQSQINEDQLLYDLKSTTDKLREYEDNFSEYVEKTKYDAAQFNEKYNIAVLSFQEQIQRLSCELQDNKALYEDEICNLTSQTKQQQSEINDLEAKISQLLEVNKQPEKENNLEPEIYDLSYEQKDQSNIFRQLKSVSEIQEMYKGYFLTLLNSLKEVKYNMKMSVYHGAVKEPDSLESSQSERNNENLTKEALSLELEKVVIELLNLSVRITPNNACKEQITKMITSTPYANNHPSNSSYEASADCNSSCDVNDWISKCVKLESENKQLTETLFLLRKSLNDMEHCLLLATQESKSFNEKCKILDDKITELEQSKLSDHLMKKENADLKERLIQMVENELRINRELEEANKKYIKLEKMYSANITDLHRKVSESEHNPQLEHILTELKEKSEEVIYLKSQLVTLQKTEKELKGKALDAQSKYASLTAKFEHLNSEISKKNSGEQTQINRTDSKCFGPKHSFGKPNQQDKYVDPLSVDLSDLSQSRLDTMQWIVSTKNMAKFTNKTSASSISLEEKIQQELQTIDQELADQDKYPMMPTIPEEDSEEERLIVQATKTNQVSH